MIHGTIEEDSNHEGCDAQGGGHHFSGTLQSVRLTLFVVSEIDGGSENIKMRNGARRECIGSDRLCCYKKHGDCSEMRSRGYVGFSTGFFGVMGDIDNLNTSGASSNENMISEEVPSRKSQNVLYEETCNSHFNKCQVSQNVCLCYEDTIEKKMSITMNSNNCMEKFKVCPGTRSDGGVLNRSSSCFTVGAYVRDHNNLHERTDHSQHNDSVSQRALGASCGEIYFFEDGGDPSVQRSFAVGAENYDGCQCNEEIRTVHNDAQITNHRLSKVGEVLMWANVLSIHTNNDEFFFFGGHPPNDGRISLRSRGSISRKVRDYIMLVFLFGNNKMQGY
ncbi:hypothetical protein DICVIV_07987 [Dictyocaulus viviparus]|uniref:Uncharacterized protein n=1 Tax=Dictyocaulus viviparus TaxID=29172 RepID=A0A0D8XQB8_DICVI|nr:hypothetical protein DICVIV_07987 [Dictyocaulus viviparus]